VSAKVPNPGAALFTRLFARFDQIKSEQDLNESIECLEHAVKVSRVYEPQVGALVDRLVLALQTRFDLKGEDEDLNAAIHYGENIVTEKLLL